jgi:hypothetical protein
MSESDNIENFYISPDNSGPSPTLGPSSNVILEPIIDCEIFNNERFSIKIPEGIPPTSDPINDNYADDVIIHACQSSFILRNSCSRSSSCSPEKLPIPDLVSSSGIATIIKHIRTFAQYIHSYKKTAVHDIQYHEPGEYMQSIENEENTPPVPVISIHQKCVRYISTKINNQDTNQKISVVATICMELYRILMGSLLLSFVPQKCGDHICGITENFYVDGAYYVVYIINILTFISFIFLYIVEIKRENRLITYLDVSNTKPTDAISVAENLRKLPDDKRCNILYIDKIYQQFGCFVIAVYVFNTIASGIVIYDSYLDNKTTTSFLTNILFIGTKVSEVYSIANTENNIFFSAYLKHKVQYNDVDPDKIADIEFGMISNIEPSS